MTKKTAESAPTAAPKSIRSEESGASKSTPREQQELRILIAQQARVQSDQL